jgi:hypothetical protein
MAENSDNRETKREKYNFSMLAVGFLYTFYYLPLIIFLNAQTMHIKPTKNNGNAMCFLKTLYPGGIRIRVFCSRGGWDVPCAKLPPWMSFYT